MLFELALVHIYFVDLFCYFLPCEEIKLLQMIPLGHFSNII